MQGWFQTFFRQARQSLLDGGPDQVHVEVNCQTGCIARDFHRQSGDPIGKDLLNLAEDLGGRCDDRCKALGRLLLIPLPLRTECGLRLGLALEQTIAQAVLVAGRLGRLGRCALLRGALIPFVLCPLLAPGAALCFAADFNQHYSSRCGIHSVFDLVTLL